MRLLLMTTQSTMTIKPKKIAQLKGKYNDYIPEVLYYAHNYIILGEDHVRNVMIQKYKTTHLLRYLSLIQNIAQNFGIYFEGGHIRPYEPITSFMMRNKIKGNYKTWEPTNAVKLSKEEQLLLALFGTPYTEISKKLDIKKSENTLITVLEGQSNKFTLDKKKVLAEDISKLAALSEKPTLVELGNTDSGVDVFKKFHTLGQEISFEDLYSKTKLHKVQLSANEKRGSHLKTICELKGGEIGRAHV